MTRHETEADARISIDALLREAGWDPVDKSMVRTEVQATPASDTGGFADRTHARPFETHAPVYDLVAAAGSLGPDRALSLARNRDDNTREPPALPQRPSPPRGTHHARLMLRPPPKVRRTPGKLRSSEGDQASVSFIPLGGGLARPLEKTLVAHVAG